jgi:hypothetical protein
MDFAALSELHTVALATVLKRQFSSAATNNNFLYGCGHKLFFMTAVFLLLKIFSKPQKEFSSYLL